MQRVQQDNVPSSSTNVLPSSISPLVAANPSTPRSRRTSAYPPLSHQTQIMKAVRRSSALPSLSLSIPASPKKVLAMSSEETTGNFSITKEDRAKTVTFSEPEDQDVSDTSSICQSPSWEQYGQKKKKSKKRETQKTISDKEAPVLKKRGNRLVKPSRPNPLTDKRLSTTDCSLSAPELDISKRANNESVHPLVANPPFVMAKSHEPSNGLGHEVHPKPKSKGFLSNFRFNHGNVIAVQKILESRKGIEFQENEPSELPLHSIQYETIPAHDSNAPPPSMQKPRKPSSVISTISTSDHSLSSQEKRNHEARTSTGSGHGRSQSLISSTLNKLRGPSYLYYHPSEEGPTSDGSNHAGAPQDINPVDASNAEKSDDRIKKVQSERPEANHEQAQNLFDFSFPPKPRRVSTEPGPDIAPRARKSRPRRVDSEQANTDHAIPVQRPSSARCVQIEIPHASTRDTVMAMVTAQERQSQSVRAAQKAGSIRGSHFSSQDFAPHTQARGGQPDRRISVIQNQGSPEAFGMQPGSKTALDERLPEEDGKLVPNRNQRPLVSDRRRTPEDDQISVGTYASTIRASTQYRGSVTAERSHPSFNHQEGLIYDLPSVAPEKCGGLSQAWSEGSVDDLISFEREPMANLQQPLQPQREVDYFASFSHSYVVPPLDCRVGETTTKDGGVYEAAQSRISHGKECGRFPRENKVKNSPAISIQYSDSDVPAFERLGLSAKAAKVLAGADTASTSTAHSHHTDHTDPSRTTSERSSSSTCGETPPSPSSATTSDSSRPQSRKEHTSPLLEPSQTLQFESNAPDEDGTCRRSFEGRTNQRRGPKNALYDTAVSHPAFFDSSRDSEALAVKSEEPHAFARAEDFTVDPDSVVISNSVSFADVLKQEIVGRNERAAGQQATPPLPPRAHSAVDLPSVTRSFHQSMRLPRLQMQSGEVASSISLPNSPPPELADGVMPRKSALKMSRNNGSNGLESIAMSAGGAYLHEARKTVPVPPVSSLRPPRPSYSQKNSSGSIRSAVSQSRAEPLAKMLVECCNCHFFHDMPSRVYECMAKPDSVVEDKSLGVSAAITTMVRCPWCAHGMTTQCCSGYAAVVYLKEKLHGK
ncbi:hypothetical protein F5Y17DRAFT_440554 [Xylariaceae sp. FL0594]|nr:hypothetical protein F5Y17DRAFT_440554 [Xylariaceae sp. FL0594]